MQLTANFNRSLDEVKSAVHAYLQSERFAKLFSPEDIREAAYSYLQAGGKSLRPAVLLFSCGASGGNPEVALPAAAAIEMYHTWTLVHDDIIDNDTKRRGLPTVHERFRSRSRTKYGFSDSLSSHYGLTVAILAGDLQQGWSAAMLAELLERGVDFRVVAHAIRELYLNVQTTLIDGEMQDVVFSRQAIETVDEDAIVRMLWKKTGVLYRFAGQLGAMIGVGTADPDEPLVRAIADFASSCGTAFQLQDDILGIVGDEQLLGKPVGSDIREGKRTTILYHALRNSSQAERARLLGVLGRADASTKEIEDTANLLRDLGGIARTQELARSYISSALDKLEAVPQSDYRDLLLAWANFMIQRQF